MSPAEFSTTVLYRPESPDLAFLPEGPQAYGEGKLSWVAIQHGTTSKQGSLNVLDFATGENHSYDLPGRPGFAFPTTQRDCFVVGLERHVGIYDVSSGEWTIKTSEIDAEVENTIINDGEACSAGIVFGAKDLEFQTKKAGLYFLRTSDQTLFNLRDDQICSNGKVIVEQAGQTTLFDIDSPTQQVVSYVFDIEAGTLGPAKVVLDLSDNPDFPDGMVMTPDGQSLIIAFYHPGDTAAGEARQYNVASGELEAIWKTPGSPQVTCPQLLEIGGEVKLVLTTAAENMSTERQNRYPDSGCLFVGETPFDALAAPFRPAPL